MDQEVIKILLVEDDEDDYIMTRDLLSKVDGMHYELQWIPSYSEALAMIDRKEHDAYLFDYCLGERTGLDLLNEATAHGCSAPMILLAAQGDKESDMEAMKAGAADYLIKGQINPDLLARSIRYAIERKGAEEALRKSQDKLLKKHKELNALFKTVEVAKKTWEKTMDCVGDAIILTDHDGNIIRINKAVTELTHKTYNETLGTKLEALIHEMGLEETAFFDRSIELFQPSSHKWFELSSYPLYDHYSEHRGTVITIHETTSIKKMSQELKKKSDMIESNRRELKSALDEVSILIQNVTHHKDTSIRLTNPFLKKCYEVKQCLQKECTCFGKEPVRCWQVAGTYCDGEMQGEFSQKYDTCSTCEIYRDATSNPIYEIGEQFNNMMNVLEIKNKELEDAIQKTKESEEQFRSVAETANDAIISIDCRGTIVFWNEGATRIFGYPSDEIIGNPVTTIIHERFHEAHQKGLCGSISTGKTKLISKTIEITGLRKDGTEFPIEISLATWQAEEERYFTAIIRDITERKRTEEEIKQSQSMILHQEKMASIGQLAAGVAHEINNPMGFISSNIRSLEKYVTKISEFINAQTEAVASFQSPEKTEELRNLKKKLKLDFILDDIGQLVAESLDGANRVKTIVQNLKSFSRVDQAEHKPADINECIESTLNIVWNELKYKVTLHKSYGDIPLTKCYPQQLNQVFMNLLINGAQAIEKEGEITIKTWNGDDYVNISISDSGKGIPEDTLNKIFDPFFTTKPVGKGTGLGLSIAYDIVKKHHGHISVESEVGKGTTFTIKIPVIEGKSYD